MARKNKNTRSEEQVRHGVSVLKKYGILSKSDNVDRIAAHPERYIRKAGPRGGTYTIPELLDKYDDIISGKATPVKLDKLQTAQRKKLDYEVIKTKAGKQVVVPHAANETVTVKRGNVFIAHPSGIVREQLPVEYHNLRQYLADIAKNKRKINKMRQEGKAFAFSFFGGRHFALYEDIGRIVSILNAYETVQQAITKGDSKAQRDIYRHLEIVQADAREWKTEKEAPANTRNRQYKLDKSKRAKQNRKQKSDKFENYREGLSPAERRAYKEKAKQRAKKSRERRKK